MVSPSSLLLLSVVCGEVSVRPTRQNKRERKGIPVRKQDVKSSLFADSMLLHLKDPKIPSKLNNNNNNRTFLVLINTFSKIARYTVHLQVDGEMVVFVKCLLCKCDELSPMPTGHVKARQ